MLVALCAFTGSSAPALAFNPQPDPPVVGSDFNPQPDPPGSAAEGIIVGD